MSRDFTISQISALGKRLRKSETAAADLEHLDSYRRSFDAAYRHVIETLRGLGLEPSGRIKTTISIVEKLKRQSFRLSKLQDIAGCRIVVKDLAEQNFNICGPSGRRLWRTCMVRQALKYGRGPADIQEILTVESEIFALLEESEGLVAAGLNIVRERAGPIRLSDFVSGKPLPTEVIELMNWYGNLQDLIRRKEKKKKEIMREILKLKRRKKNDDLSG